MRTLVLIFVTLALSAQTTIQPQNQGKPLQQQVTGKVGINAGTGITGVWNPAQNTFTLNANPVDTNGVITPQQFGAIGSPPFDDTAAFKAAINKACSQPSGRTVTIPSSLETNYYISSTIPIPCDNLTIQGLGTWTRIYSNASPVFDTNRHSWTHFDNLFLSSLVGNIVDQVGIYVNSVGTSTTNTSITNSFLGGFGVKPNVFPISACTNALPTICTTTTAPASGPIVLGGFQGNWVGFNSVLTATNLSPTTFSLPFDTSLLGPINAGVMWGTTNTSGAAIQVRGDNLSLTITGNQVEVWGTGVDIDGTVDMLNLSENTFGVSTSNGSGYAILVNHSAGSGQNKIHHNNIVTPGGAMYLGPNGGQFVVTSNQYEALGSNPPLMNADSAAFHFDSALDYAVKDNSVGLHSTGNYCYLPANSNYGKFEKNKCFDFLVSQWNMGGAGPNQEFDDSSNLNVGTPSVYSNPNFLGIYERGYWNGYRGWGTQYPLAPFHFNSTAIPFDFRTTLAAAITTTAQSSITLNSAVGLVNGMVLYIDGEQLPITDVSAAPVLSVGRGANGTTAATHLINALVTLGGTGVVTITSPATSATKLSFGIGASEAWVRASAPIAADFLPVPLDIFALHTIVSGGANPYIAATDSTGPITGFLQAASGTTSVNIGSSTNHPIDFQVNSTTKATLDSAGKFSATIFDAATGFQIGGLAANGDCLLGNGTNFVGSSNCALLNAANVFTADQTIRKSAATMIVDANSISGIAEFRMDSKDAGGTDATRVEIFGSESNGVFQTTPNIPVILKSHGLEFLQGDTSQNTLVKNFLQVGSKTFASLGTPANGYEVYCSNCDTPASQGATCTSAGDTAGAWAKRIRGAWQCY